jgi:pimeloyl-ACP methyl ester carboxylesterase
MRRLTARMGLLLAILLAGGLRAQPVPVVFVHGNGDHAGLWDTMRWRFESQGYPADRLFALSLPRPVASATVRGGEPNRSTPAEQVAEVAAFVERVRARTGASRVALVGSSRGGLTIRRFVRDGGHAMVSHVVTCGTPNHGVFALPGLQPESEFNGAGPYLRALNDGREVEPGVATLAIRSDGNDKYAQPDGAAMGMRGVATGVDVRGPSLAGAEEVVLPGADHREVAFSAGAFRAVFAHVTGRAPTDTAIVPQAQVMLDGLVSGEEAGAPTNLPLVGARVTVHAVDRATGERLGAPVHRRAVGTTGRWGPFRAVGGQPYEFEVEAPDGRLVLHLYRPGFPRGTDEVTLRLPAAAPVPRGDSVRVLLVRPRGYLGAGRDTVQVDGRPAAGIPPGVPTVDRVTAWFGGGAPRSVALRVNTERLVVRTHPGDPRRVVVAEVQHD